jgi:hypothetical protein
MPNEQHPKATLQSLRERLQVIATENDIDVSVVDEPLDDLLERIRTHLQDQFERVSDNYSDLDAELDEIEGLLADQDDTSPSAAARE